MTGSVDWRIMDTQTALQQAVEILTPWTRWSRNVQPEILEISVSRKNLLACVEALRKAKWGYLSAITGLNLPDVENKTSEGDSAQAQPKNGSFLVLYHFCNGAAVLNLRVHPPSTEDAEVPSIASLIYAASIYERELMEMFGITVVGTPDPAHFLLPEDWPDGVYPLRKSFTGLPEEA
jgi:Ni,Fe-hydrogenase III component G